MEASMYVIIALLSIILFVVNWFVASVVKDVMKERWNVGWGLFFLIPPLAIVGFILYNTFSAMPSLGSEIKKYFKK